jgi:hypothetical protein
MWRPALVQEYRRRFVHHKKGEAGDEFELVEGRGQFDFDAALVSMNQATINILRSVITQTRTRDSLDRRDKDLDNQLAGLAKPVKQLNEGVLTPVLKDETIVFQPVWAIPAWTASFHRIEPVGISGIWQDGKLIIRLDLFAREFLPALSRCDDLWRVRECEFCRRLFYARRYDKCGCRSSCLGALRQRKRGNKEDRDKYEAARKIANQRYATHRRLQRRKSSPPGAVETKPL